MNGHYEPPQWALEPEVHDWRYWLTVLILFPLMTISVPALSILAIVVLPVEPAVKIYIGTILVAVNIVWARLIIEG